MFRNKIDFESYAIFSTNRIYSIRMYSYINQLRSTVVHFLVLRRAFEHQQYRGLMNSLQTRKSDETIPVEMQFFIAFALIYVLVSYPLVYKLSGSMLQLKGSVSIVYVQ